MLLMKNTLKLKSKQMEFTTKDQELIKECKTTSLSWHLQRERLTTQLSKLSLSITIQFKVIFIDIKTHPKKNSNFLNPNGIPNNKCLKLRNKKRKSKNWFKSKKRRKELSLEMINFSSIKTQMLQLKLQLVHLKSLDF